MPTKNRDAQRQYQRTHYANNRKQVKREVVVRRELIRQWLRDYKSRQRCQECGENDSVVLDFHHRNSEEKDSEIGNAWRRGWGKKRILAEIKKCDVLCANCHRRLHGRDYQWV